MFRNPSKILLAALLTLAPLGLAQSANAAPKPDLKIVSNKSASLSPGQSAWVAPIWTANCDVSNVSTTVKTPSDIKVSYPTTRGGSDTSFFNRDSLLTKERDFTAFRLALPYSVKKNFKVEMKISYVSSCNANKVPQKVQDTQTFEVVVKKPAASQAPIYAFGSRTALKTGTIDYLQIAVKGGAGDLSDVKLQVGEVAGGLAVSYPGDRSYTSPNKSSGLVANDTDFVTIKVDARNVAPRSYQLPVTVSFVGEKPGSLTGKIDLNVTK